MTSFSPPAFCYNVMPRPLQSTLSLRLFSWLLTLAAMIGYSGTEKVTTFAALPSMQETARKITVRLSGDTRGSGTLVGRRGMVYTVLTNAHVVQKVGSSAIVTPDGKCHAIKPSAVRKFPGIDLAIILFSSKSVYSVAQLGKTNQLAPDQTVFVGGWVRPGENWLGRVFLVTEGQLTDVDSPLPLGYSLSYTNLVRVGMSGGPILDQQGRLIGINGLVRLLANSDDIVASGIKIDPFLRSSAQLIKTITVPPPSPVTCSQKYAN